MEKEKYLTPIADRFFLFALLLICFDLIISGLDYHLTGSFEPFYFAYILVLVFWAAILITEYRSAIKKCRQQ